MKAVVKEMTSDRGNQIDFKVLVLLFEAILFRKICYCIYSFNFPES